MRNYYQYIIALVLVASTLFIIYGRDIQILANEIFQNEAYSHILFLPFLTGILFYVKRKNVNASLSLEKIRGRTVAKHLETLVGVALCIIAFLIYWRGSYTFYPLEYHILSLPVFLAGVTLILFNLKATLTLLVPILFTLFAVPPPTEFMYIVGGTLANINTQASYTLLKAFNLPVALSTANGPPTLTLTNVAGPTYFPVDLACSGIYSALAFAMFAVFLAVVVKTSLPRKLALMITGFIILDLLNIIRITTVVSAAHFIGFDTAQTIHTTAGFVLVFIGVFLTLALGEKLFKIQVIPKKQEPAACPECKKNGERDESFCQNCGGYFNKIRTSLSRHFWTKTFLLILGCSVVAISINAPTFAISQGPVGVTSSSSWENATNVFPEIPGYQLDFNFRDRAYEELAGQDASLVYTYTSMNDSKPNIIVVIGVANSISNLHSWEVCLVSWQIGQGQFPLVQVHDSRETLLLPDVPLTARFLTFTSPENYTQTTLYWYGTATFNTGITTAQKYVRISLLTISDNATGYEQYENELENIGQKVAAYWEPLKSQALVSLGIPAQQAILIASIAFVAIATTTQYSAQWRKRNSNMKLFNNLAPKEEKQCLQTIQKLAENKKTFKTSEIAQALQEKLGQAPTPQTLNTLLEHLEEYGFIRHDLATENGAPVLAWKT